MKRAAIYARYSSDLQRKTSIEDQVRLCRARAVEIGARVVEVYSDSALTGTLIQNRPALQRLLADAKKRRFDVVIVEGLDRLNRDQEGSAHVHKRLSHADVTIHSLTEGDISELHVGMKGTMNALFVKDLGHKVRRGQGGRALAGRAPGGLTYGYRVVKKYDEKGEPIRGFREIIPERAEIVRRIFRLYAMGVSARKIARTLNQEGIPSPRGGQWNSSTISGQKRRLNGILRNPIYIGKIVYNRVAQRQDPDSGKYVGTLNPESSWIFQDVPALRIIDADLWRITRTRLRREGAKDGDFGAKRRPKRLLSGLIVCGCCASPFTVVDRVYIACGGRRSGKICDNGRRANIEHLEREVLGFIRTHMIRPDVIEAFNKEFEAAIKDRQLARRRSRAQLEKQKQETETKIARIIDAIADGTDTPTMRKTLMDHEAKLVELKEHAEDESSEPEVELLPNLADLYRARLARLEVALNAPSCRDEAIHLIRRLIERVVLHPKADGRGMDAEVFCRMAALAGIAKDAGDAVAED